MTARDIKKYYHNMNSISEEIKAREGVQYRYYFQMHDLDCPFGEGPIDLRNQTTWCLQEAGR